MIHNCLKFLEKLEKNNNREWFAQNKNIYESARSEFELFVVRLIAEIGRFDADIMNLLPKDCIFKIYRDVRFSKDKSPYKINMGASFNKSGKKIHEAGYYFHLEPSRSFIAGGLYMPLPDALKKIRQEIYYNYSEFLSIISNKHFIKTFKSIEGNRLTLPPKGYSKDFAGIEYLKYKDYTVMHYINPSEFNNDEDLIKYIAHVFKTMKPLIDFLNRAI